MTTPDTRLRTTLLPGALLLGLVLLLAGCGSLTAGGLTGEATVVVSGDAPETAAPVGLPLAAADDHDEDDEDDEEDEAEGQIEATFRLFLVPLSGRPISLSDDEVEVRLDLRGRQEADAVQAVIPADRYTALRIVFSEIDVEVESGLVVNGQVITGEIEVELEGGPLTVERSLPLDLTENGAATLLVDLNTQRWIRGVNADLRRVTAQNFANAVEVRIRSR